MNFSISTYLLRSLRFYWRWHLGLLLGVAVAAWVIVGSLAVGDSVKATLENQATLRLGKIDEAVSTGEGFISQRVVTQARTDMPTMTIAPVLYLKGTVSVPGGAKRANGVNLIGVDAEFWKLATRLTEPVSGIAMNQALAATLQIKPGETIIARFEKPSLISRDAPLSGESDQTAVINSTLGSIVADDSLGAFSLKAEQAPPLNLFVPIEELQAAAEQKENCNLILAQSKSTPDSAPLSLLSALQVAEHWELKDVGIEVQTLADGKTVRVVSPRIFLPEALVAAGGNAAKGVLTYLCNSAAAEGENYTAYPMISAVDPALGVLPQDIPARGMVINQWMAENLKLKVGDKVELSYFTVTRARQLSEAKAEFTVHSILPMDHPAMNAEWTPDFPGVSDAANCRDWKPGIPMKTQGFIKDADETYWQQRKATPKAFIPLKTGQEMWANRFGNLTSLRFDAPADAVTKSLKEKLKLADLGFAFVQPQVMARAAVDGSMDFGSLFLSMSFFLIVTALVLAALLFLFNVESRATQVGLLRALGMTGDRVRMLFIIESLLAGVIGAALGAVAAVSTTGLLLQQLETDWSGAVAGMQFVSEIRPGSVINGIGLTLAFTFGSVWFLSRRLALAQPQRLIAGDALVAPQKKQKRKQRRSGAFWLGSVCVLIAVGMAPMAVQLPRHLQPGVFFGAAVMLLTGGILLFSDWLNRLEQRSSGVKSTWALGLRNAVRRRGRSLAIMGLLASGIFMVTALHTFHLDAEYTSGKGTGGFALLGTSDLPIYEDLNTPTGRDAYGLDAAEMKSVQIVSFRQREGEEASCLNLNQAQAPSVLGVDPSALLDSKFSLSLWKGLSAKPSFEVLNTVLDDGAIPAIADQNSAMWALKKGLGDIVDVKDAKGNPLKLRLVAFVSGTILQGHLLIAEKSFLTHFPDTAGNRFYLIQTPAERADEVAQNLSRQLQNRGLALQPTRQRLAQLQAVQNTYLQIFSTLGGIALILSTAALALLIARNVLERQAEFGLLQASGFRPVQLRQILLGEHLPLFLVALVLGVFSAMVAVWPHVTSGGQALPVKLLVSVLSGLTLGGIGFCFLASYLALRRPLMQSLRQE